MDFTAEPAEDAERGHVLLPNTDLDLGLVDFLAPQGEEQVCLCWKVGEPRVEFWHGLQEGYAGRKPIGNEFA